VVELILLGFRSMQFMEEVLWSFFMCLVDGISVMSEGDEYTYDPVAEIARKANPPVGLWLPYIHFDIKPRKQ
jgi:hypothetical protein